MRKRPPNRLMSLCDKVKNEESGFVVYIHFDRELLFDVKKKKWLLGPVTQISLTPKTKTGSGLDSLFAEITRILNREIQVQEVT